MKKFTSVTLAILILTTASTLFTGTTPSYTVAPKIPFAGGSGTLADPYIIENVWELQNMSNNLSANYTLGNDVDATITSGWNSGAGFAPIGNITVPFTGSLEGQNRTITSLFINRMTPNKPIGLFGQLNGDVSNLSLFNVNISGLTTTGGLAGWSNQDATVSNCSIVGNVSSSNFGAGGLIGSSQASISNSYASVNISGVGYVGGLVGFHGMNLILNSHYNIDNVLINGGHYITIGGLFNAQYQSWISNGLSLNISDYSATLIPSGGYYEINGIQGLRDCMGFTNKKGYKFSLTSNIEMSSVPNMFIPYCLADFDGRNNTVYNLTINLPFVASVGFIGLADEGCILSNISLVNVNITGYSRVGGLLGNSESGVSVTCAHVNGNITGVGSYVGGLAGTAYYVSDSYFIGNVSGANYIGGLLGAGGISLSNSYAIGNVNGTIDIGGLVGINWYPISNSYAIGNVRGTNNIGGLVGHTQGGAVISNSYSREIVTRSLGTNTTCGGFVGYNDQSKIINCYSTGLVHYEGAADPTDKGFAGGVVTGGSYEMTGNFWDTQTSGQTSTSGNAIGKTTIEMKTKSTFTSAGWDFTNVWCMLESITYPLLRWQDIGLPTANAGPDGLVGTGTVVTFNGMGSYDDIGIESYIWAFDYGGTVTLQGSGPTYQFNAPGVFVVTLNVTDPVGNWNTDTVTITVNDLTFPLANAGPDQSVNEDSQVTFDGSASTDNVGITSYWWNFTDGMPVSVTGIRPNHTFVNPGIYTITLTVRDDAGNSATDTIVVTVKDISTPLADAGSDQIVDAGALVKLNGSSSIDNVGISNYTWSFTYNGSAIILYGVSPTFVFSISGNYTLTLTARDAAGNIANDAMIVTVRAQISDAEDIIIIVGPVKGSDGNPISGATVNVTINGTTYTGLTDADGNANITLPASALGQELTINITKDGYESVNYTATLGDSGILSGPPIPSLRQRLPPPIDEENDDNNDSNAIIYIVLIIGIAAIAGVLFMIFRPNKQKPKMKDEETTLKGP